MNRRSFFKHAGLAVGSLVLLDVLPKSASEVEAAAGKPQSLETWLLSTGKQQVDFALYTQLTTALALKK